MSADFQFTDGVCVIDKPIGPTSHDVVAVMRRVLRSTIPGRSTLDERRSPMKVGHTGTLDPFASGVLPLVLGKATRLAQFLSAADKAYEADIELGRATTTFDHTGDTVEREYPRRVHDLTQADIEEVLAALRGTHLQRPPAFSAKKIEGDRAYRLARRNTPVVPEPVEVTAMALDLIEWRGSRLRIRLVCSAGFYVRSLADSIGERLGTGAHLAALTRTRSGDFSLRDAVGLDILDTNPAEAARRVIRLSRLLPSLQAVTLTVEGAALASRGGFISPSHAADPQAFPRKGRVRLLHPDGRLLAIAEPRRSGASGVLHPTVVLE